MTLSKPTSHRFDPETRVALDKLAKLAGCPRSELVRQMLADGVKRTGYRLVPPTVRSQQLDDGAHRVLAELEVIPDDADDGTKSRIATRNTAVLSMRCPSCDGRVEVADWPARTWWVRPSVSHPRSSAARPPAPPAPAPRVRASASRRSEAVLEPPLARRVRVVLTIRHDAACPAAQEVA